MYIIKELFIDLKLWVNVFLRFVVYVQEFEFFCWYERKNNMMIKKIYEDSFFKIFFILSFIRCCCFVFFSVEGFGGWNFVFVFLCFVVIFVIRDG